MFEYITINGMDPKIPWQIMRTKLGYLMNLIISLISDLIIAQTPCCFSSSDIGAAGMSGIFRKENTDALIAIEDTTAKAMRHPLVGPNKGMSKVLSA